MAKAGYVSFGPFPFGQHHDTQEITELLADETLLWIETAHFRIGCALGPLRLRSDTAWGMEWIARVRSELKRLHQKLPRVDIQTRELDRWYRAHLVAQRLEELWAEVCGNLGVSDSDFPAAPGDDPRVPESYRGAGPFLGMPEKFRVLLLVHGASHARYTRSFQASEISDPIRDCDDDFGSLYYGASEEAGGGLLQDDLALQTHLAFNVAHNLYSGYRGHGHELPAWLVTGLGHWHARNVSARFPVYDRANDADQKVRPDFWEWEQRIQGLAKNAAFEPLSTFVERGNAGAFQLEQHMQCWALVDWLMRTRKTETMRFLHALKEPFHARTRLPEAIELRDRQHALVRSLFGCDWDELGGLWRAAMSVRRPTATR